MYLRTFHWYIVLFHEPSFRRELDPIISSSLAQQSQKPFLLLLLATFVNTVQFCDETSLKRMDPTFDKDTAEASWIRTIEQNIFASFDELDLSFIGCLFIMTTIYLQRKKTPLALSLVAMMVRATQSMNLHQEHLWGQTGDAVELEIRRMISWSVFMSDGYEFFVSLHFFSHMRSQIQ